MKPTGEHFTQPGHKTSDMTCTVIEQVLPANDPFLRKRREKWWINKYQAVEHGANTQELRLCGHANLMPPFLWPEQILANNTKTTPLH